MRRDQTRGPDERAAAGQHDPIERAGRELVLNGRHVADRADERRDQRVLQVRAEVGPVEGGVVAERRGCSGDRALVSLVQQRIPFVCPDVAVLQARDRSACFDALTLEPHREQRVRGQHDDVGAALTRGVERLPECGLCVSIFDDNEKH